MKSRLRSKVTTDHPLHKLWESASDIVARTVEAYNNAKVPGTCDTFARARHPGCVFMGNLVPTSSGWYTSGARHAG